MPVDLPKGVEAKQADGMLRVKGPKGDLEMKIPPHMVVQIEDGFLRVERPSDSREHRALHGLTRSLAANMVEGVSDGFKKTLQIIGVGYRAEKKGKGITLHLGFSHVIDYAAPEGVTISTPSQTEIVVAGSDKQRVGQAAAEIRALRPPEPYKGKGVRYANERIVRKEAKKK